MARPRINDTDKRIVQVNIRLTQDENARIIQYASASGMSVANWMRRKVFTGKFPPVKQSPLDAAVYRELRKIGVNLNQVTHKINAGEFPNDYLARQLELQIILNRILKLLINDRQPG